MHKYKLVSKKGEGTFSEVLKAQSIKSGKSFAIKCMKNLFDSIDQVNNLREIQALRRLAGHPNIIKLNEVLYDEPTGRLALVFELMEMNLYETIKGRRHYLPEVKVKSYMYDLMKGLDHMHRNGIFHRDVKPENLLLGNDDEVKLADLGSCRGIYSRQPYTEYISTRWYRAPECLLTDGFYNFKMDLFAAGCVWFEIVALFPLFPGQNEMDQMQKIHNVLGTPDPELLNKKFKKNASHMDFNFPEKKGTGIDRLIPHADPEGAELIKRLIRYDPDERALARQVLKDGYFRDNRDAEKERGQAALRRTSTLPISKENVPSPCSSSRSVDNSPAPEVTHPQQPSLVASTPAKERSGGLPNIRHEHWKVEDAGSMANTGALRNTSAGGIGGGLGAGAGGGVGGGNGANSGTEDDAEDSALLPPIGGFKTKKGHRSKGSKVTKQASLPSGTFNSSKGFSVSGTVGVPAASRSHTPPSAAHTQASNHPWVPAVTVQDTGRETMESQQASVPQMTTSSSTWALQRKLPGTLGGGHKSLSKEPGSKRR